MTPAELASVVSSMLVGKPVREAFGARGCGSIIQIGIGDLVPRALPPNASHQLRERHTTGPEFGIMLYDSWRLFAVEDDREVSSPCDSNERIIERVPVLVGSTVEECSIDLPTGDLEILFSNGLALTVLGRSPSAENAPSDYAWSIGLTNQCALMADAHGQLRIETEGV